VGRRLLLVVDGSLTSLEALDGHHPERLHYDEGTLDKPPRSIGLDDTDGGVLLDVLERPYPNRVLVRRTLWRLPT
jgi:hypothetical protein